MGETGKRDSGMTTTAVSAWADGFGIWHARVDTNGSIGEELAVAQDVATERIRDELAQREGPHYAPETVNVRLSHRRNLYGVTSFYFAEIVE